MSHASKFDNDYYIGQNFDVNSAINNGSFENALEHFNLFGAQELRAPKAISYYRNWLLILTPVWLLLGQ